MKKTEHVPSTGRPSRPIAPQNCPHCSPPPSNARGSLTSVGPSSPSSYLHPPASNPPLTSCSSTCTHTPLCVLVSIFTSSDPLPSMFFLLSGGGDSTLWTWHAHPHTHPHTHAHTLAHKHTLACAHTDVCAHTHRAVGRAGGCGWSCGCSELHTEACEAWWHHKPECFVCWCSDLISCLFVASLTWSSVLLNCIIDLICTCILSARFIYRRRSWSSLPMKCFLGEHGITSLCGGKCSAMSLCRLFVRADRLKQNLGKASLSFLFLCFRIYFIMKYLITKSSSW